MTTITRTSIGALLLAAAGCGGSSGATSAPPTQSSPTSVPSPSPSPSPEPSPSPSPAPAAPVLTGFAALPSDFAAAHQLNTPDCTAKCFDGTVVDSDGTRQARIVLSDNYDGPILGMTMHFAARTPISSARVQALGLLPRGAKLTTHAVAGRCMGEVYRSALVEPVLGKADNGKQYVASIYYYSPGDRPYDGHDVAMAILGFEELGDPPTNC